MLALIGPGSAAQRDRTMLRIAGRTLHRVRDTGGSRSSALPAGNLQGVRISSVFESRFRRRAGEHRMPDTFEPLAFGGGIIPPGIIGHGSPVVAVCSAVGAE